MFRNHTASKSETKNPPPKLPSFSSDLWPTLFLFPVLKTRTEGGRQQQHDH